MGGGRLLFPALPLGRALPWVLAGVSTVGLVLGFIAGSDSAMVAGGLGLAGVIVGYPLARLVAGHDHDDGKPPARGDRSPRS